MWWSAILWMHRALRLWSVFCGGSLPREHPTRIERTSGASWSETIRGCRTVASAIRALYLRSVCVFRLLCMPWMPSDGLQVIGFTLSRGFDSFRAHQLNINKHAGDCASEIIAPTRSNPINCGGMFVVPGRALHVSTGFIGKHSCRARSPQQQKQ
jgi:hypothetical protein